MNHKKLLEEYKELLSTLREGMMSVEEYEDEEDWGSLGYAAREVEEERANLINAIENYVLAYGDEYD